MNKLLLILFAAVNLVLTAQGADAPPDASPVQLVLELSDGSRIIGTPAIDRLKITTQYSDLEIRLPLLSTIEFNGTSHTAQISLKNGDLLNGKLGVTETQTKKGRKPAMERFHGLKEASDQLNAWNQKLLEWLEWINKYIPANTPITHREAVNEFHVTRQGLELLELMKIDIYPDPEYQRGAFTKYDLRKLLCAVVAVPAFARLYRKRLVMKEGNITLIAPHRQGRTKPAFNDGRWMSRYRKRWKIERLFAWLHNFRRLVVRYEYCAENYHAFLQLACALILIRHL